MAIKVTTNETKQDVKPFPKLMIVKNGIENAGTVVLFKEKEEGIIVAGTGYWEGNEWSLETDWDINYFTDYNEPITIQNA